MLKGCVKKIKIEKNVDVGTIAQVYVWKLKWS